MIKNKKGSMEVNPVKLVLAIALLIIIFIALTGGGALTLIRIASFMAKVPAWMWLVLIVLFIFGGRRK